ncbi:MAG: hypothetical protein LBT75_05185 [Bacilli bacterium]|nr:hypothetical protein [Bacilli bacterium]
MKINSIDVTGTYHVRGTITVNSISQRIRTATKVNQYIASDISWYGKNDLPLLGSMYYRSTADVVIKSWNKTKKEMVVQQRASFNS